MKTLFWLCAYIVMIVLFWIICGIESLRGEPVDVNEIYKQKEMKWIDQLQVKRKIVRCKYCDTDVSTPYKGIHDEVEIINGFPSPCRNNGRLNADIAFPSLANIDGIEPRENVKWFIEDVQTRLWWNGFAWTQK